MSNRPSAAELFTAAVADRIRGWREALEISPEIVAERSGLSVRMIKRIEAGTTSPNVSSLQALARALEAEPYELIDVGGEDLGVAALSNSETGRFKK